jgi:hypothetical protein
MHIFLPIYSPNLMPAMPHKLMPVPTMNEPEPRMNLWKLHQPDAVRKYNIYEICSNGLYLGVRQAGQVFPPPAGSYRVISRNSYLSLEDKLSFFLNCKIYLFI